MPHSFSHQIPLGGIQSLLLSSFSSSGLSSIARILLSAVFILLVCPLLVAQQTTEAAIDSLYDPVIITDGEGCVTKLNQAAQEIFGSENENTGKHVGEIARDDRISGAVAEALESQRPVAGEGRL